MSGQIIVIFSMLHLFCPFLLGLYIRSNLSTVSFLFFNSLALKFCRLLLGLYKLVRLNLFKSLDFCMPQLHNLSGPIASSSFISIIL